MSVLEKETKKAGLSWWRRLTSQEARAAVVARAKEAAEKAATREAAKRESIIPRLERKMESGGTVRHLPDVERARSAAAASGKEAHGPYREALALRDKIPGAYADVDRAQEVYGPGYREALAELDAAAGSRQVLLEDLAPLMENAEEKYRGIGDAVAKRDALESALSTAVEKSNPLVEKFRHDRAVAHAATESYENAGIKFSRDPYFSWDGFKEGMRTAGTKVGHSLQIMGPGVYHDGRQYGVGPTVANAMRLIPGKIASWTGMEFNPDTWYHKGYENIFGPWGGTAVAATLFGRWAYNAATGESRADEENGVHISRSNMEHLQTLRGQVEQMHQLAASAPTPENLAAYVKLTGDFGSMFSEGDRKSMTTGYSVNGRTFQPVISANDWDAMAADARKTLVESPLGQRYASDMFRRQFAEKNPLMDFDAVMERPEQRALMQEMARTFLYQAAGTNELQRAIFDQYIGGFENGK